MLFSARNARVLIGNPFLGAAGDPHELFASKWSLNVRIETIDTTNFTSNGYASYIPGVRYGDCSVEAFWDSVNMPTADPPCIYPGARPLVYLYLSKPPLGGDIGVPDCADTSQPDLAQYWYFFSTLITEVDCSADAHGMLRYDFKFRNDGPFEAPGTNNH